MENRRTEEACPSSSVQPFSALWLLVVGTLAACVLAATLEAQERLTEIFGNPVVIAVPTGGPGPSAASCPEPATDPTAIILARAELEGVRQRLKDLENRNQHLRGLLEQQTVAKQRSRRANISRVYTAEPRGATEPRGAGGKRLRAPAPNVSLFGDRALIAGTVANGGARDEEPRLTVQLLQRGQVIEEKDLFVAVPAGSSASYSLFVPISQRSGSYSAKVYLSG